MVDLLIFLVKFFIFLKRLLSAFFVGLIYKPVVAVLRFLFYKVFIRLYQFYFSIMKKIGWADSIKHKSLSLFFNQKLVHFMVASLTIFFVIFNLTSKTQAVAPDEIAGKTFLSEIISPEFSSESGDNGELIEEYFDEEEAISSVQQTYLDNLTAFRAQPSAEMAAPEEDSLFQDNLSQDGGVLVKPDFAATTKGQRPREGIITYEVSSGDTISTIAVKFGVSVNTILWENNLNAYSLIRPGNKLSILPMTGIAHTVARGDTLASIAAKYKVEANVIMETNKLASAEMLSVGKKLIIPGGTKSYYSSSSSSSVSGLSLVKDLLSPESLKSVPSNKLAWPTVGSRITQYYSWRHHGLDIGNKTGTPIYATDAGVIELAGWGSGYGNQIVINHGGGRKSRYAHLSKFYVSKGQTVQKGQAIGAMGSTGNSTGPHLHFEYIINGVKYNPLNYLK